MKRNLNTIFENNVSLMEECLELTKTSYRSYDPALYLYKLVLDYPYEKKFSHEFIELLYVTLTAWGMNSRSAKLSDFEDFEKSILSNKASFDSLKDKKITELDNECFVKLQSLFDNLQLVKSDVPLVTFSKALHFILPDLIGPIDRKYTLTFFDGYASIDKDKDNQFFQFMQIHVKYSNFAKAIDLTKYIDNYSWNRTVPKIIDNIIIGYIKKNGDK